MRWITRAEVLALALAGCGGGASYESKADRAASAPPPAEPMVEQVWAAEEADLDDVGIIAGGGLGARGASGYGAGPPRARPSAAPSPPPPPDVAANGGEAGGDDVRRWFPEAFLWQPLVETSEDGVATVEVIVPDQLTTWRVLALAHDRRGQQAGAVHTFDSRLPIYVDPVVPGWLYAGDEVWLPVQVASTQDQPVTASLDVRATGALSGQASGAVVLAPYGSAVRQVVLRAEGAGPARVRADLGTVDAAEREIPVRPRGRPVESQRGGTLADVRQFGLAGAAGADPSTEELEVLVFPGPLAVLQAEVERAGGAGVEPWSAGYGFALAGRLGELAAATGVAVDEATIRRLQLTAWQRVVHHSRYPDAGTGADLLLSIGESTDHALAADLRTRLVRVVTEGQRGDGTWARQERAPLQQVVVQTALAARVLPVDEAGPRLKAAGAIERYVREIDDPYTAAVALASGLAHGELRERLISAVVDGLVLAADGSRSVVVPDGALNPWGWRPARAEVLAWTVLALLEAERGDLAGDLVSELVSGYTAGWGFGAGPADVLALEAVARALPGVDQPVRLSLVVDGVVAAQASVDPAQPRVPAVLAAAPRGGSGSIELRAEPAVPGLAFVATRRSWVPWRGDEALPGVEVDVSGPAAWTVGVDDTLRVAVSAPAGVAITVEQGLPAGATVDEVALRALVGGALTDARVDPDRVVFTTRAFTAGEVIEVPIVARPAFAGAFSTSPLRVSRARSWGEEPVALAPVPWRVRPPGSG